MNLADKITTKLVSTKHGFHDFDVINAGNIHRATVSDSITYGDGFNIYSADGTKSSAIWLGKTGIQGYLTGDLEHSLFAALKHSEINNNELVSVQQIPAVMETRKTKKSYIINKEQYFFCAHDLPSPEKLVDCQIFDSEEAMHEQLCQDLQTTKEDVEDREINVINVDGEEWYASDMRGLLIPIDEPDVHHWISSFIM